VSCQFDWLFWQILWHVVKKQSHNVTTQYSFNAGKFQNFYL
jgi:hypothetical protein